MMSTSWYIISRNFGGRIMNVTALIEVILLMGAPKPPWPGRGTHGAAPPPPLARSREATPPPPPKKNKNIKDKPVWVQTIKCNKI